MTSRRARTLRIKVVRLILVLGGIVAGQFILYGPSLVGKKILLPLDILALPRVYLPVKPEFPQDFTLSDLVELAEPARQFAFAELHAGRLPMWNPYEYAGCPVTSPKFSPFFLAACCTASPAGWAWTQLLTAVVAGTGIYLFFRRALRLSFWPAVLAAWCYPITSFFVLWQGFGIGYPVCWLPWLLLAVDRAIRGNGRVAPIGLSIATTLVLISGALDIAGQVLLVSGLYAVWQIIERYRKQWFGRSARRLVAVLATGWLLGLLLAAPSLLPLLEYSHTGVRMLRRAAGTEERPPVGLTALPQTVLPDMYGSTRKGSLRIVAGNQMESSAAAYVGLLATLFAAPLAWFNRRHRSLNVFWLLLAGFGLSWCLDVPGVVTILRLPGLNLMSHNRLVFATSLALLALAAEGLDALWHHRIRLHRCFLPPIACLAGLFAFGFYRFQFLPEPVATGLGAAIAEGKSTAWINNFEDVSRVQHWFASSYGTAMLLCGLALMGWLLLVIRPRWPKWAVLALGLLMAGDLLWFAHGRAVQSDPSLDYPRIPALAAIGQAAPDRVIGVGCLPATLAETHRLRDIRGYDAIDPAALMDLMNMAADPDNQPIGYALTQWFLPRGKIVPEGITLSPILDMLGVRYAIFRGAPPAGVKLFSQSPDYWVVINQNALSRAFIPKRVEAVTNAADELQKLASPQFNPREVAYVDTPLNLPDSSDGRVQIVSETPNRVTLSVQMATPGLVVLADLWDKGWRACLNGQPASILRVNHALRGVVVPVGESALEFRYEPASFRLGVALAGLACAILLVWFAFDGRRGASETGLLLEKERENCAP